MSVRGGLDAVTASMRIEELESKVETLQFATFALAGTVLMGAATAAVRMKKMASFNAITAQRIMLVQPSGSLRTPDRLMAELSVRAGNKTELRMHGGSIVLSNPDRTAAVQIASQFQPLVPKSVEGGSSAPLGSGQAWAIDRHGLEPQLRELSGQPALVLYGPDERPLGALRSSADALSASDWTAFGALEPPRSDPGGGSVTTMMREREQLAAACAAATEAYSSNLGTVLPNDIGVPMEAPSASGRNSLPDFHPVNPVSKPAVPPRAFDFASADGLSAEALAKRQRARRDDAEELEAEERRARDMYKQRLR